MGSIILVGLAAIVFVALMVVLSAVKIVPEYERGVVFRLGRRARPRPVPAYPSP